MNASGTLLYPTQWSPNLDAQLCLVDFVDGSTVRVGVTPIPCRVRAQPPAAPVGLGTSKRKTNLRVSSFVHGRMKRVQRRGSDTSLPTKAVSNEVVSAIKASALNSTPTDHFAAPGVHRLESSRPPSSSKTRVTPPATACVPSPAPDYQFATTPRTPTSATHEPTQLTSQRDGSPADLRSPHIETESAEWCRLQRGCQTGRRRRPAHHGSSFRHRHNSAREICEFAV